MNGEPEPKAESERTQKLHLLYATIGQLLALESAKESPRILIDGDIEVPWPDDVKNQIDARIVTKGNKAAGLLRGIQDHGKPVD